MHSSNDVCDFQGDLAKKVKSLKTLQHGAQAVLQATVAPCTELGTASTLAEVQSDETLASRDLVDLPRPLFVLASEMRIVQALHKMAVQVCALQQDRD
jgi:hypothetical protein